MKESRILCMYFLPFRLSDITSYPYIHSKGEMGPCWDGPYIISIWDTLNGKLPSGKLYYRLANYQPIFELCHISNFTWLGNCIYKDVDRYFTCLIYDLLWELYLSKILFLYSIQIGLKFCLHSSPEIVYVWHLRPISESRTNLTSHWNLLFPWSASDTGYCYICSLVEWDFLSLLSINWQAVIWIRYSWHGLLCLLILASGLLRFALQKTPVHSHKMITIERRGITSTLPFLFHNFSVINQPSSIYQ